MIELEAIRIAKKRLQVRSGIVATALEAHQMLVAFSIGELDDA